MSTAFKQIFPQGKININYAQYFIGQSYLCKCRFIKFSAGNVQFYNMQRNKYECSE